MVLEGMKTQFCVYPVMYISEVIEYKLFTMMLYFFHRSIPVEVLHTFLLGPVKYFLKEVMPKLSKLQKMEILAWISAFNFSGFRVKVHGNVCYYYRSFVGRDYKAWSQMALFILSPYIGVGEQIVLLALSKVFRITYCDFFDPTETDAWQQICVDLVHSEGIHANTRTQTEGTLPSSSCGEHAQLWSFLGF